MGSLPPSLQDEIPIVDFSRSRDDLDALAAELKDIFSSWGFVYIKNHGLPQAEVDRMFEVSSTFFKTTSLEEKSSTPWDSLTNAGYDAKTGTEGYFKENGAKETVSKLDTKEVFVIRKQDSYDQPLPPSLKQFNPEIQNFMKDVHEKIAMPVLSCLGIGLGLPADYLPNMHQHGIQPSATTIRLIHYPPLPSTDKASTRLPAHSDQGVVTVLFQNKIGGLQVRPRWYTGPIMQDEVWIDAPVIPGAVLINIGETMTFFSGGLMKSTPHRVTPSPLPQDQGKERFSMAYFLHPNLSTLLQVLPGLEGQDGVAPRETPISCVTGERVRTVKDWIEHRHSMGRLQKA